MFISRFELVLGFAEETQLETPAKSLRKELDEDKFGSTEEGEHIIKRDEKAKFALSWRYSSCSMVQESKEDGQECIKLFLTFLEKINGVAPIGKLSATTLRVDWIFPVKNKTNFKNLELNYRKTFVKDNGLFEKARDSSVVVDMNFGQWDIHHQSGPMNVSQLQKEYRVFKIKENHPTLFLFLTTELANKQIIEYSKKSLGEYINSAFQISESHAKNFGKIVEGIL